MSPIKKKSGPSNPMNNAKRLNFYTDRGTRINLALLLGDRIAKGNHSPSECNNAAIMRDLINDKAERLRKKVTR